MAISSIGGFQKTPIPSITALHANFACDRYGGLFQSAKVLIIIELGKRKKWRGVISKAAILALSPFLPHGNIFPKFREKGCDSPIFYERPIKNTFFLFITPYICSHKKVVRCSNKLGTCFVFFLSFWGVVDSLNRRLVESRSLTPHGLKPKI